MFTDSHPLMFKQQAIMANVKYCSVIRKVKDFFCGRAELRINKEYTFHN